jgi:hypothetical protein
MSSRRLICPPAPDEGSLDRFLASACDRRQRAARARRRGFPVNRWRKSACRPGGCGRIASIGATKRSVSMPKNNLRICQATGRGQETWPRISRSRRCWRLLIRAPIATNCTILELGDGKSPELRPDMRHSRRRREKVRQAWQTKRAAIAATLHSERRNGA